MSPSWARAFLIGEYVLAVLLAASGLVFGVSWVAALLHGEPDLAELVLAGLGLRLTWQIVADLRKQRRRARQIEAAEAEHL
jgi:hypothetical protein